MQLPGCRVASEEAGALGSGLKPSPPGSRLGQPEHRDRAGGMSLQKQREVRQGRSWSPSLRSQIPLSSPVTNPFPVTEAHTLRTLAESAALTAGTACQAPPLPDPGHRTVRHTRAPASTPPLRAGRGRSRRHASQLGPRQEPPCALARTKDCQDTGLGKEDFRAPHLVRSGTCVLLKKHTTSLPVLLLWRPNGSGPAWWATICCQVGRRELGTAVLRAADLTLATLFL